MKAPAGKQTAGKAMAAVVTNTLLLIATWLGKEDIPPEVLVAIGGLINMLVVYYWPNKPKEGA